MRLLGAVGAGRCCHRLKTHSVCSVQYMPVKRTASSVLTFAAAEACVIVYRPSLTFVLPAL